MTIAFYTSGAVAVIAALLVVTRVNVMHALVSLIVAFLAVAGVLWSLGAPFAAVLQIVIYAGAIMVLFVFAVMVLNLGERAEAIERSWLQGLIWAVPALLAAALLAVFAYTFTEHTTARAGTIVGPKLVGQSLFFDLSDRRRTRLRPAIGGPCRGVSLRIRSPRVGGRR